MQTFHSEVDKKDILVSEPSSLS